jgi:glycerol-3-phosphate acyltransferase PlsY
LDALASVALVLCGYFVGAVPWGVILGRWRSGTDLREHGSGATGSTNAFRILGWRISLAVLVLDYVKGLVPVVLAIAAGAGDWVVAAVAVATVVGHCWSPFIRFQGGKGMATGAGAATAIAPWTLLVLPLMIGVVALSRYVSLASLVGSTTAAAGMLLAAAVGREEWSYAVALAAIAAVIVVRHRDNISRLRAGTERKISWRARGGLLAQPPIT